MAVISLSGVSKAYRGMELYRDVNLEITQGGIYSLEGPNGCGKSVLLRLFCGFITPDSGEVVIDQRYLHKGRSFPERFGVIIDRPGYLAGRTGLENLKELAAIRGEIGEEKIRTTLQSLGLDPDLKQKMRRYSLGMKQKVAIAQALMEDPEVLILDEPFNALDATSVQRVKQILRELNAQGVTIVFTSHNMEDIHDLAQHRFRIDNYTVAPVPA